MLSYNHDYIRAVCRLAAYHTDTLYIDADITDERIIATYERDGQRLTVTLHKAVIARGAFIRSLRDAINGTPKV